ncbi:MAG TPA: monofunctional biosynthetic peptidoglycan transglycosylase [Rhodobacteraceae bacterium]|nr:monofunctional biosynthetic peptidoglycan transglycosylase [Paracoccaceae bacterium]
MAAKPRKPSKGKRPPHRRKTPAKRPAARRRKAAAKPAPAPVPARIWLARIVWRWFRRLFLAGFAVMALWVSAYAFIDPPGTFYMQAEKNRLGDIDREWVPLSEISDFVPLSVVAAEDVNFCLHWGFDMSAIRAAIAEGGNRGGSTITQQVVKNAFLWQGRSWPRKALEALFTPMVELIWTKRRILEVYLNIIEFDEGVFGIEAAARRYFDTGPEALSPRQAALLAAVLPNPKARSAARPTPDVTSRALRIEDGAATIRNDARSACFKD